MTFLRPQRRLAMRIFSCGKDKVWMDPSKLKMIAQAKTRSDVEKLIDQQIIVRRPLKSSERPWWRYDRIYNKPPLPKVQKSLTTQPKLKAIVSPVTLYNIPLEKLPEGMRKQMIKRQDQIRQYTEKAFVGANVNEVPVQKEYMEKVLEKYAAKRITKEPTKKKQKRQQPTSTNTNNTTNTPNKSLEDID